MHILKCPACKAYGLSEKCGCGTKRERAIPPKFNPEDKYASYRRMAKESKDVAGNDA